MQGVTPMGGDLSGLDKHTLHFTPSQKKFVQAVQDWLRRPRKKIVILSGGPGTGKTFVVTKTFDGIRLPQVRMALTARSAKLIGGRTIHSTLRLDWSKTSVYHELEKTMEDNEDMEKTIEAGHILRNEFQCAQNPSIVIIDEVGMINAWTIYGLIDYFMGKTQKPLLIVMMGDHHQLHPVRSKWNLFSIVRQLEALHEVDTIHLLESKRFDPHYGDLINCLREYVDAGNMDRLCLFVAEHYPIVECVDAPLLHRACRAMAFKNATVESYNDFYIREKIPGKIIRLYKYIDGETIRTKYVDVKPNCLIFVNQNGVSSVSNGTTLTFKAYDGEKDILMCEDYDTYKPVEVRRNDEGVFPIDLGFAGTLHKFQGQTIDDEKIIISFDGNYDLNLIYTALSRVKNIGQILAITM